MSLALVAGSLAMAPGVPQPFTGIGGTPPYAYLVLPNGVGGTIDPSSGLYTAPNAYGTDNIQVSDSAGNVTQTQVLVGSALQLLCDVIQQEMDLGPGQVYLWDQKINIPNDNLLYVAVAALNPKPFSNSNRPDGLGNTNQYVNMATTVSIDIISRGPDARDRKEQVILALNSNYAQSQQELNSFYMSKISTAFVNLSEIDGAAIPYRFNISMVLQYAISKTSAISYFDNFSTPSVVTNP